MISHPYIKYGIALIMEENSLHSQNDISLDLNESKNKYSHKILSNDENKNNY